MEVAFGCRLAVASGTITASVASALFINYHDTIPKVSSASSSSWCGPHTETASNGNDSQTERERTAAATECCAEKEAGC